MQKRKPLLTTTIADCTVQTFRAGGPGGQNQNKRDTGVRVIHPPSGARGESREERTQAKNKQIAFRKMAESAEYRKWARVEVAKTTGALDRAVKAAMHPSNIKVETYDPNDS